MYQFWILDALSLFYVIPLFIVRLFIRFMRQVHKICTQFPPLVAFLFRYSSTKSFKGKTSCRIRIAYICSGIIGMCISCKLPSYFYKILQMDVIPTYFCIFCNFPFFYKTFIFWQQYYFVLFKIHFIPSYSKSLI